MKKVCLFVLTLMGCLALTIVCYAKFNSPSPPGKDVSWNFTQDHTYTIASSMDINYTRGVDSVWPWKDKYTSVRTDIKGRSAFLTTCFAGVQTTDGVYAQSNRQMTPVFQSDNSISCSSNKYLDGMFVRYEGTYFQLNGNQMINITDYIYMSEEGLVR